MFRSKLVKGFILGLGLSVVFSTAAFAEPVADDAATIQVLQDESGIAKEISPDAPVSNDGKSVPPASPEEKAGYGSSGTAGGSAASTGAAEPAAAFDAVSDAMYKRQGEIDRYLFEEHKDEIAAKGISVTHTVASNEYVEIGITPYSDENAEYLYNVLGRDQLKVVEGTQAVTLEAGAPLNEGGEIYDAELYAADSQIVSAPVDEQLVTITADTVSAPSETTIPSAAVISGIAAAIIALLGGALVYTRRMKTAKR